MMRLLGFILALCFLPLAAQAADCAGMGKTNVNKSYEIDRADIEKCMQEGKDPPQEWIKQGGESADVASHEGGVGPVVPSGLKSSNGAVPHYEGTGCGYIANNTHPGGKSDNGARDGACGSSGDGGTTFEVPTLNFPLLPDLTKKMMNCISNFGAGVQGDYSKMCITGSAKFCGMNVGGGKCAEGSGQKTITSTNLFAGTSSTGVILGKQSGSPIGILGPVGVSGPTTVTLSGTGQMIQVPAGSTLYVDDPSTTSKPKLHIADAFGNIIGNYLLKGGTATIATPQQSTAIPPREGSMKDDGVGNIALSNGAYLFTSADTTVTLPNGNAIAVSKGTNLRVDVDNTLHIIDGTTAVEIGTYALGSGAAILGNADSFSAIAAPVDGAAGSGYINLSPPVIDANHPQYSPNGESDSDSALPNPCLRQGSCQ